MHKHVVTTIIKGKKPLRYYRKIALMTICKYSFLIGLILFTCSTNSFSQKDSVDITTKKDTAIVLPKKKAWYETLSIRGYTHIRYNRLLETNDKLKCDQCDRSIGNGGGFFFRRARLVLYGDIHDRVFIYIQGDFATNATNGSYTGLNYLQLRDLYGDIYLDKQKTFRVRLGLSKVPFGFENIQSSQNRFALDRTDALNSAMYNERDMGAFLFWTPKVANQRFLKIVTEGLKGSGNYGVASFGLFNGQTTNRNEMNKNLHTVARIAYPFEFKNGQFLELGLQAFSGYFNVREARSNSVTSQDNIFEQRIAGSFILYPQPFGLQAEYNIGDGPTFTIDPNNTYRITRKSLQGGYIQIMYMKKIKSHIFTPYYRYHFYNGSKKIEVDARDYEISDHNIGIEWLPMKAVELTAEYMISHRKMRDSANPNYDQRGNLLRLQVQFNY